MARTTISRRWTTGTVSRVGVLIATLGLVVAAAGTAQAASIKWNGDFSWDSTTVKRLANCAAVAYYVDGRTGDQINECGNARNESKWDSVQGYGSDWSFNAVWLEYKGGCPTMAGTGPYIKCFFVGGQKKGNPAMTVSQYSYGLNGFAAYVSLAYQ